MSEPAAPGRRNATQIWNVSEFRGVAQIWNVSEFRGVAQIWTVSEFRGVAQIWNVSEFQGVAQIWGVTRVVLSVLAVAWRLRPLRADHHGDGGTNVTVGPDTVTQRSYGHLAVS